MLGLVGVTAIEVMHPTVTVRVVDPDIALFCVEVAVIVVVPSTREVTRPLALIVAMPVGLVLQVTDGLPVLPSLKVPDAVIWTVFPVVPVSIVGVAGPTEIEDNVGFTKNPVQLTARANVANTPKAPASRSLVFADDMII
jgi:hypothetical protein